MSERSPPVNCRRAAPGLLLVLLAAILLVLPAGAMTNPAAGYCAALGYQYTDTLDANGSMVGSCVLANNLSVDAWKFLQGSVSPELSYCQKQGLAIQTVSDPAVCGFLGSTCAVCVKADGKKQEVTKMMGLDFREKICTQKYCCDPATNTTCPIGTESATETDWSSLTPVLIGIIILVVIILVAVYLIMRKKKEKGGEAEKKAP
jgi:putative hemolysin